MGLTTGDVVRRGAQGVALHSRGSAIGVMQANGLRTGAARLSRFMSVPSVESTASAFGPK